MAVGGPGYKERLDMKPIVVNYSSQVILAIYWRLRVLDTVSGPNFLEAGVGAFKALLRSNAKALPLQHVVTLNDIGLKFNYSLKVA